MPPEEIKKNSVVHQNPFPKPGTVAERNGDYRIWLPTGKAWKIIVEADGGQQVVASGVSSVKEGKFCLNIRTRVTDRSDEPEIL